VLASASATATILKLTATSAEVSGCSCNAAESIAKPRNRTTLASAILKSRHTDVAARRLAANHLHSVALPRTLTPHQRKRDNEHRADDHSDDQSCGSEPFHRPRIACYVPENRAAFGNAVSIICDTPEGAKPGVPGRQACYRRLRATGSASAGAVCLPVRRPGGVHPERYSLNPVVICG